MLHQDDVGIYPEYFVPQVSFKPVHYRKDNDQRGDAQENPGDRYKGDDGDKDLLPFGPKVSKADKKFKGHR
jgi:hypothetical protein